MSRVSSNEMKDGYVWNGYDYDLQVWVINGIIQDCGHTDAFRQQYGGTCCNAHTGAGQSITLNGRRETPKIEDSCQTKGCENEVFVDDYGVVLCKPCLDQNPEAEAYLRRQANKEASR